MILLDNQRKSNRGGRRPGSGRKSKAEELGLVALLNKCFGQRDREIVITKLAEDSMSMEFDIRHEARKLLLAYTFGRPTEHHEISGPGGADVILQWTDDTGSRKKN
jgi:hypothetical protein